MNKNKNILDATSNAWNGFKVLLQEKSARREIVLILFAIAFFCYRPNVYTVLLAVLSLILLAVEALNTALEKLCDHITLDHRPEIKIIKDLGAVAVFIVIFAMVLILIRYISPFF